MAKLRENDQPVSAAPREKTGQLIGESAPATPPAAPSLAAAPVAAAPMLLESPHDVAAPPRESMAGVVTLDAEPAVAPEPSSVPAQAPAAVPEPRRIVGLPARPRLRVSYWFEGAELRCEAVLMDESRNLVKRSALERDPAIEGVFTFFATKLARELASSGVLVVPASPAPTEEAEPAASPPESE
jgi:hypothetical protein